MSWLWDEARAAKLCTGEAASFAWEDTTVQCSRQWFALKVHFLACDSENSDDSDNKFATVE